MVPEFLPYDQEPGRPEIAAAQRIVLKVGTRVLTHDNGGLALSRLYSLVETAATLRRMGREILIVSSGAVELGREALGMASSPADIVDRQVCAAVGQGRLMGLYQTGFGQFSIACAQVLLCQADLDDRDRYLHLRAALNGLLARGAVPILNENDAVATDELALKKGGRRDIFGDNDRLSALVAIKLEADLLVVLTDVDGVYDRNPLEHEDARLILRYDDDVVDASGTPSRASKGGMKSKIEAAVVASQGGCDVVIGSGRGPDDARRILAGENVGTWFPAHEGLDARRSWMRFATAPRGTLHLDAGAVCAIKERGASLLAAGVIRVDGQFERGDVVELQGPDGTIVAKGQVHCDARVARAWSAGKPPQGIRLEHPIIYRKHLVLETMS